MLKLLVGTTAVSVSAFGVGGIRTARGTSRAAVDMNFHEFKATTIDGKEVSMGDYKGKPILVLNVASL